MDPLVVGVIVGVAGAALTGGRVPLRPPSSYVKLASVAGGVVVVAGTGNRTATKVAFGLAGLLLLRFALTRRGLLRLSLAAFALGMLANSAVILANGAMPVNPSIGAHTIESFTERHEVLTDETRLPWLADILPYPFRSGRASVGDYLMWLAVPAWILAFSHSRDATTSSPPAPAARLAPSRRLLQPGPEAG